MASVLHGRLGGYLLLTIFLVTCLSAVGRTVTENLENVSCPEATIPQGTVRGVNMETYHGKTVNGFIGIPYAQPPVGDLRFKEPSPPTAWNGTLDASTDTTTCLRMTGNEVVGDEDCLYLNVFTPWFPANESSTLLPVIFHIFGGAFQSGSNSIRQFNPDFLLDKDVILVVPNFRVGVLGFLSTGDEVSPGNNGLKDIVRALEWSRDNIRYFSGDPERVTLAGSSSGAMSVSLFLMSDLTEAFYTAEGKFPKLVDNFDYLLPHLMGYSDAIGNVVAYTAALKSYYLNDFTVSSELLLTNLTQLVGDATFVYPLYKELNQYVALAKSPQYYFVFEYDYSGGSTTNIGVAHGDVLIYVFRDRANFSGPASYRFSEADWKMVDIMVELWTSFAINGAPNAKDENGTNIWEPYSSSSRNYGKEVEVEAKYGWNQERMDFLAEVDATITWIE